MAATIFLASLVFGITGFGFALVTTPILSVLTNPKFAIPSVTIMNIILNLITLYEAKEHIRLRQIAPLVVSGIVGTYVGATILVYFDIPTLKILVGIIILAFSIACICGFKKRFENEVAASIPIGLLSGIMGGLTSISGPPVVLFFNNQGLKKEVFRANLVTYFFILYSLTIPSYLLAGLISRDVIIYSVIALPIILIGDYMGIALSKKFNEEIFHKITLIIIAITGSIAILSSL